MWGIAMATTTAAIATATPERAGRASTAPICRVTHVSSTTPPSAASPRNGPPTWLMPRLANGTPPNGKQNRMASARVNAAGRPTHAWRPRGATAQARPWKHPNIATATT